MVLTHDHAQLIFLQAETSGCSSNILVRDCQAFSFYNTVANKLPANNALSRWTELMLKVVGRELINARCTFVALLEIIKQLVDHCVHQRLWHVEFVCLYEVIDDLCFNAFLG